MSALFLAIPLTIFVLFVLPIWLWLHYSNRSSQGDLSQSEQQRLAQLTEQANKMRDRIQALESQVTQLQAAKPSSGGFLSGLFGGGQSRGSDPIPGAEQYGRPQANAQPQYAQQAQNYAPQAAWMETLGSMSEGTQTTLGAYHRKWQ